MASLKKKVKNYVKLNIAPTILSWFVRFIYFTSKKTFHHPTIDQNENFIISMWHGDLLMQPFNFQKLKPKGYIKAMISEHKDGEIIAKTVSKLGIGSIRGSSTRGGAKALIGAIKTIKEKNDVAITPDGPQGPIYSIADGIVILAQKTEKKIICLSSSPSKYWQFNSWDKFRVPKPFGVIDFYISEPLDLSGLDMEDAKNLIKKNMRSLDE